MKRFSLNTINLFILSLLSLFLMQPIFGQDRIETFKAKSEKISIDEIRTVAVTQNGRIKPFASLARETILFLSGKSKMWGVRAEQIYLGLLAFEEGQIVPLIEVRSVELRKKLLLPLDKRHFSLQELSQTQIENLARPIAKREEEGAKLSEEEKKVLEAYSQLNLGHMISSGEHLARSIDFSWLENHSAEPSQKVVDLMRRLIQSLQSQNQTEFVQTSQDLKAFTPTQSVPEMFRHSFSKLDLEVNFYDFRPFLWAALLAFLFGFIFIIDKGVRIRNELLVLGLILLQMIPVVIGLGVRVYITQFAPITNMYGTMIWVAFGVSLFNIVLFVLYKNKVMTGWLLVGSGLILFLTENIPLVLSPDMDPIVAVLRSNFWLSTHVTTITISYAALTIAMILGNLVLFKTIFGQAQMDWIQDLHHYAYRMVQLGCFLLTVGIILGGVWADYSWGRFWGWDPKETWALIADMGFLALLHARYIGWVSAYSFLAMMPAAYLLVIMAWYGVNFILASGLHSYGFSSGGAKAIAGFVIVQIVIIGIAMVKLAIRNKNK